MENLLKKEYNLEGHAHLVGKTLYLNIDLAGLVSHRAGSAYRDTEESPGRITCSYQSRAFKRCGYK